MADSFTLPLRPILEQRDCPDTLPVEIAQINNQWGSFREVNESVLRNKIAEEQEKDDLDELDESDQDATDLDSTERLEQLYKRRAEITQFAMQAHMETMFALDFVSLLLSKQAPRQAETSMSAFLKQVAPLGSLNAEVVNPPPKPESTSKDISTVSRGWRIQNFNAAANKLLQAASRLETEVASETRYWNEVLAVKDKGWKISRLPRERQALGVQYGFLEATPVFRDRGLASLRRAEDGALLLDEGLIPSKARYVRVRVIQDGRLSGSSKPMRSAFDGDGTIEDRILQARDTVYEDELFYELVREARAIASFGVTTRQNLIQIPASNNLEILLDLVDIDENALQPQHDISQHGASLAEGLAHTIRILLAYAHRQNLRRRTLLPPPLTPKTRSIPEHQLIRPALAYIKHMSDVRWLQSLLNDLFGVLQSANLKPPAYTARIFSTGSPASPAPTVETLVGQFLTPLQSTFSGKILIPRGSFSISIHTNLSSPPFGTIFDVSFNMPKYPDLGSPGKLSHREEVEAAITHLLLLDVVFAISSNNSSPKSESDKDQAKCTWEAIYPQHGELLLSTFKSEKRKKMKIALSRHELSLEIYTVRCIDGTGRGNCEHPSYHSVPHIWKSSPIAGFPNQSSVMDFVSTEVSRA
ncbi:Mediator complex subunit Med17 [Penicillium cf. griseofulvum]|uniref:Mediator of RNA polymerase II transcription subunit 17 n=1 Tax=Penicillium cf. griseofulvum TaxID=2972120 RepID=A0A9W9J3I1_9EURO|nr:Mediator complex subunit Med17 [Penicillium cf. griseofulvum]KAJ5434739.1 Mediator complex subunit Med17 [Penicillium cf. griseofulvum]